MITTPLQSFSTPRLIVPASGIGVRYETALCDKHGRVLRVLQRGRNMITNTGMDSLATTALSALVTTLHLGSATQVIKRLLPGGTTLTVDYTNPAAVLLTTSANFFDTANDVGRTLQIGGWPELEITVCGTAITATGKARNSVWLPGFTPSSTGPFTDVGIHYTSVATLATEFTTITTFDTGTTNNNACINDGSNSRFNHQRIFLSAVVTGSDWTVLQLGWGTAAAACFGKTTLGSADTVPVGLRYRVTLNIYSVFTSINLAAQSFNWGATIGTIACNVRSHRINQDINDYKPNVLKPRAMATQLSIGWWTNSQSDIAILYEGDAGFNNLPSGSTGQVVGGNFVLDGAYTNGTFSRTRTFRWPETVTVTAATKLGVWDQNIASEGLYIKPTSGTITKPSGWRMDVVFPVHWTRQLTN
jgi:hypothetical protein